MNPTGADRRGGQATAPTVEDVRAFWEAHPLWTGESAHAPGSAAFFAERTLPFRLPRAAHRLLDRRAGFLIYAGVSKR